MKNEWQQKIKVVGWDLDGTLYPSPTEMWQRIEDLKYERVAQARHCTLEEAKRRFDAIIAKLKSNTKTLDELGVNGQQFFIDVWNKLPLEELIQPDPKLVEAFRSTPGILHAILTNSNTSEQVLRKLRCIGIPPETFKWILTSVELEVNKPDPRAFLALIQATSVQPEEILYVGDREEVDIKPAHEAGMRTALVYGESGVADVAVENSVAVLQLMASIQPSPLSM